MKVLELEPLKKKSLKLVLLESEFPIPWWLEAPPKEMRNLASSLGIISKEYLNNVEKLIQKHKPNFVIEEKGMRSRDDLHYEDALVDLFRKNNIPYKMVDISDNALDYLTSAIESDVSLLKEFQTEIKNLKDQSGVHSNDFNLQNLVALSEYLQLEYKRQEDELHFKVREMWMMMEILELAREQKGEKIKVLFICDKGHFNGITEIATELGVDIEKIRIKNILKKIGSQNSSKNIISKKIHNINSNLEIK